MAEIICPSCGRAIPDGSQFCTICGARLSGDASEKEQTAEISSGAPADVPAPPAAPAAGTDAVPVSEPAPAATFEEKERPWAETVSDAPAPEDKPVPPAAPTYEARPGAAAPEAKTAPLSAAEREKQRKANLPMTSIGTALSIILMNIPVIGFILTIVWACGGCRKIGRRNLARAYLILAALLIILSIVAALLARFVFADDIIAAFERLVPGYTIQFN